MISFYSTPTVRGFVKLNYLLNYFRIQMDLKRLKKELTAQSHEGCEVGVPVVTGGYVSLSALFIRRPTTSQNYVRHTAAFSKKVLLSMKITKN